MTKAADPPLLRASTWVQLLRRRAEERPQAPAFLFLRDGEAEADRFTYAGLDEAARAIAARLADRGARRGDRALLLYPPGLGFIAAFLGCLYAGVVAVPAYPPQTGRRRGSDPRLRAIAADAQPRWVLAPKAGPAGDVPELAAAGWLVTDDLDPAAEADAWREPDLDGGSLAFLQYTSGSTAAPKGVAVTHANLLANEEMISRAFDTSEASVVVGWLPLYHDMGLIGNVLQPIYTGARCVLMSPLSFLQRPVRWLEAISRYRGTTSGGPDFAYDLCVRKVGEKLGEEERARLDLSSWERAFNGAEPVRAATLERFADSFAISGFRRRAFYPCYGLAEATLFVTGGEPDAGPTVSTFAGRERVGCGHAWLGQRVAIVDPETRAELPPDTPDGIGEIWVAGPAVAAGYWGKPEETERDFNARLAGREEEGPFLRTGDLGFLQGGELFVTGRIKDLIILRGRNHYPQDLERTAETAHPALVPGASAAFSVGFSIDEDGEERLVLVAEVQRRQRDAVDVEEVADAMRRAIAEEHEVRVHEVVLIDTGTLPRTSSGKVRRRATREAWTNGELRTVGASRLDAETVDDLESTGFSRESLLALDPAARRPALTAWLRDRAAQAARVAPGLLAPDRPLTALGLDSLAAIELKNDLEEELGTGPDLSRLLEGATLDDLAADLLAALDRGEDGEARIEPVTQEGVDQPLSYGQRALWFLEKLHPETTAFLLVGAARLSAAFTPTPSAPSPVPSPVRPPHSLPERERGATAQAPKKTEEDGSMPRWEGAPSPARGGGEGARAGEGWGGGGGGALDVPAFRRALETVVARHPALRTTFHSVNGEPWQRIEPSIAVEIWEEDAGGWTDEQLQARLEEVAYRPFDLERGPLFRFGIFGERALSLTVHHLISDFWSLGLLLRELEALYLQETGGPPAVLPPVRLSFPDFVRWQESRLAGPRGEELWAYWSRQLDGAPRVLDLPTDRPRPAVQTSRGAFEGARLSPELVGELEALARSRSTTLYTVLLAGFSVLLHRWSGQEDLLLGSPTTGRGPSELAGVMGYFINPVVLRSGIGEGPSFAAHLDRTRETALAAFAHQEMPFPLLAERLQPERDPSRSPVFQVFFVLEQAKILHDRGLSAFALGDEGARMDLLGLPLESLRLPRRSAQFDLMLLLSRLDGGLGLALEYNADLFDAATARRLLGGFRTLLENAAADPSRLVGLLPLLTAEEQAQIQSWDAGSEVPLPNAPLHRFFEEQAARRPDAVAAVFEVEELTYRRLNETANRLAHRLRALGVGPEVPVGLAVERGLDLLVGLLGILKAGGAYVPLDPSYPAERLAWIQEDAFRGIETPVVVTGAFLATLLSESTENLAVPVDAGNLAYILYTSGSTGRPKGVMVTHGNVVRLLAATDPWFGFGPGDVWTLFHSFAFDFSVWEIWGALAFGGRLVVVPRETAVDTEAFRELLATEKVTVLNQTPSAFRALTRVEDKGDLFLRWVIFGGEALEPASLRPWFAHHGDEHPRLVNMYGITETTVHVTFRPLSARDTAGGSFIGKPIPDLRLHALDRHLMPVPVGVPGELCVGGAGLARGYRNRPDLTAERFVPDPFGPPGERLYRSGDLARFRPAADGLELEYLGRIDHQVKVRGFRIELGEIETVLAACPAVQAAIVLARKEGSEVRLIAYVELSERHPEGESRAGRIWVGERSALPDPSARPSLQDDSEKTGLLRAWAAQHLPDYMVPSAFLVLDKLPLTANGKVDRQALAAIDPGTALRHGAARVAPRTATEAAVARIWREILGIEEVGIEDDFFALGGHSLRATELVARVARDLGVELPLHVLFSSPTVEGLARAVDERRGKTVLPVALPVWTSDPAGRFEPFPLTEIQQAYWIGRSGAFDLGTVSTQSYLELEAAEMDLDRLERAWQRLVDRHDMLRAVVGRDGLQRVLPEVPPYRIEVLDLRERSSEDAEAELAAVRSRMAHEVLPADRWPLFEIRATRLPGSVRLHARLDALIYDASSAFLLLQEWSALYESPEAELPALPVTFREYVLTARALVGSPAWDRALAYWRGRAETLPPAPELPLALDPATLASHRFTRRSFRLPAPVWTRLKERSARAGAGPSALLAAAWSEVLGRWSRSPRFTLNLTLFQRLPLHPDVGRIVGDFTSLTLLEVDPAAGTSFEQRAHGLQERLWRDLDHRLVSGLEALREMGRRRGGAPAGMPVVFTSTLGLDAELVPEQLPGRIVHALTQTSQVWLDHQVSEEKGELVTNWDGVDALFPPGLVDEMFAAYRRLLDRLAVEDALWSGPAAGLGPVLLGPEWLARLAAANDTGAPLGKGRLEELFFTRATEAPEAPAVVWEGGVLTYGELAAQARALGRRLREAAAGPGELVAVALEKGWQQIVAVLGVLEAGAAYLPVDPGLPAERFQKILEMGGCRVILKNLTPDPSPIALPPTGRGAPPPDPENRAASFFPPLPGGGRAMGEGGQGGEDLAYVIFTSGSTGVPKGVAIDHRAALNTILDVDRRFGIGPGDRVLALSSLSFDLSVWDIFGVLGAGGALVLPEADRDPAVWARRAVEAGITVWNSVPALLGLYVEYLETHPEQRPEGLRLAMLSGDWIPLRLPDRVQGQIPGVRMVSLGGATEASIWSILQEIGTVQNDWASIPYGRPMTGQTFHVLDEAMEPQPAWVPGMLWIGGAGLARGYWRDEERTAAAFVRHPETGERLYRTGDLGRRWPDGTIEILGREDFQVKIQGYRIELGEIEAALRDHPEVREAVAVAAGDPRGERRLAAFVTADPAAGGEAATRSARLRAWLETRLPRWMVPATITEVSSFPLGATGKVDRAALLRTEPRPAPAPAPVPASDLTRRIAWLVAEALGSVEIDPESLHAGTNLLELGASSLEVIRLANRLEEKLGERPPIQSFYAAPTLGTLIRFYEEKTAPVPPSPETDFDLILDPAERDAFKNREPGLRSFPDRESLALPAGEGLEDLYRTRATHRVFAQQPVPLAAVAGLLAALRRAPGTKPKYLFPSAGALYPVQTYLHVKAGRIDGLGAGTWYYHPAEHRLVPLVPGADLDPGIHDPFVNRPVEAEAAFTLFLIADLAAIAPIYGAPALHYALLEAGAMLQLLLMVAPDRGLGLCPIGQVDFPRVRGLFDLGPSHVLLHTVLGGGLDPERESAPEGLGEAYPWVVHLEGDREEGEL